MKTPIKMDDLGVPLFLETSSRLQVGLVVQHFRSNISSIPYLL